MNETRSRIAFLGIGLMGSPQARNILREGFALTAWNRSAAKADALVQFGAGVAATPADAARAADVVILMLENGGVVERVLFIVEALRPGTIVVDMSSIRPAEAKAHAHRLAAWGIAHIDAPVSGGTVGAEQGTLAIMAGGDVDTFARVEPILRTMGRPVHVGPSGAGQFAKLANQIIVGVTIGAVAEALLLAQQGGADPAKVREALRGGFAESRILDLHGQRMIDRDFVTRGRSVTHLKDIDNALDAAHRLDGGAVPYTALTADLFRGLLGNAGDLDHSGLLVELERRNGIVA
jgi:2-hydroxy-3-oxopropionate reductase